ncbi:hypothetical protein E2I00_011465, partial [Balaenoptera physalus]
MAEEDLIFRLEGVDGGPTSRAGDSDADSDGEDGYFICPITEDPGAHQNVNSKVNNYYSNLAKSESYGSSGSPAISFHFKEAISDLVSGKQEEAEESQARLEALIFMKHHPASRYNAVTGEWLEDEIVIKMASQPFGRGAMRECFRTKKLSNFLHTQQWKGASNYVAKRYIESVDRDVYFEDVRLQMEAKLWGEEYNRHKPPKQVDIMQMCVIELKERLGRPLFHLEHYIEGKYIKYNSNSGFVRDDNMRLTPQRGTDFGDGNLGVRGMALFFHSHACNRICKSMGLAPFDLSPRERDAVTQNTKLLQSAQTILRGTEEKCGSPRVRTLSGSRPPLLLRLSENSGDENMSDITFDSLPSSPSSATPHSQKLDHLHWPVFSDLDNMAPRDHDPLDNHRDSENSGDSGYPSEKRGELDDPEPREHVRNPKEMRTESPGHSNSNRRYESDEDSLGSSGRVCVEKWNLLNSSRLHLPRPSAVALEVQRLNALDLEKRIGKSILGKHAADLGELEAIVGLGLMYSQLPHHILADVSL